MKRRPGRVSFLSLGLDAVGQTLGKRSRHLNLKPETQFKHSRAKTVSCLAVAITITRFLLLWPPPGVFRQMQLPPTSNVLGMISNVTCSGSEMRPMRC
jgi:hypothetical protein